MWDTQPFTDSSENGGTVPSWLWWIFGQKLTNGWYARVNLIFNICILYVCSLIGFGVAAREGHTSGDMASKLLAVFFVPLVTGVLLMFFVMSFGHAKIIPEIGVIIGFAVSALLVVIGVLIAPVIIFKSVCMVFRTPDSPEPVRRQACRTLARHAEPPTQPLGVWASLQKCLCCAAGIGAPAAVAPLPLPSNATPSDQERLLEEPGIDNGPGLKQSSAPKIAAEQIVPAFKVRLGKTFRLWVMFLDDILDINTIYILYLQGDPWWATWAVLIFAASRLMSATILSKIGFGFFMTFLGVNDVGAAWHSLGGTGLVGKWARYMEVRWMMEALFEAPLGICLQYYIFLRSMTLERVGFNMDPLHLHFTAAFSYFFAIFQMSLSLYKIADHARALNTNYESYLPALLRHDSDEVFERFLNE